VLGLSEALHTKQQSEGNCMREIIKFMTNVPVEVALRPGSEKQVEGRYGPQMMYTLTDQRVMYVPLIVADRIRELNIGSGEPFEVCKAEVRDGNRRWIEWRVNKLEDRKDAVPPEDASGRESTASPNNANNGNGTSKGYSNGIEKIIYSGEKIKTTFFEEYKSGNNIYTCRGTTRAFSRKLYKNIKFPNWAGDDAYSYLHAVTNGYKYKFIRRAIVYFKLPDNYPDFEKQVIRFLSINSNLIGMFGKKEIHKQYFYPKFSFIKNVLIGGNKNFYRAAIYSFLFLFIRIKKIFISGNSNANWNISTSTKNLEQLYETK
jgi:hypothetical protein